MRKVNTNEEGDTIGNLKISRNIAENSKKILHERSETYYTKGEVTNI